MNAMKAMMAVAALSLSCSFAVAQNSINSAVSTASASMESSSGVESGNAIERARERRRGNRQDRPGSARGNPYARLEQAKRLDNLTDDQKTKIEQLIEQHSKRGEALTRERRAAMDVMRQTTDTTARRESLRPVMEKYREAHAEVDKALKEILTEEQQEKLGERVGMRPRGPRRGDEGTTGARERRRERPGRTTDSVSLEPQVGAPIAENPATTVTESRVSPFAN